MKQDQEKTKIVCPYCGYELPIFFDEETNCENLIAMCKGRNCKKKFIINIKNNTQIK